jgi:hypothetical protein
MLHRNLQCKRHFAPHSTLLCVFLSPHPLYSLRPFADNPHRWSPLKGGDSSRQELTSFVEIPQLHTTNELNNAARGGQPKDGQAKA